MTEIGQTLRGWLAVWCLVEAAENNCHLQAEKDYVNKTYSTREHAYTHTSTCSNTQTHTHTHAYTHTSTCSNTHTLTHTRTAIRKYSHGQLGVILRGRQNCEALHICPSFSLLSYSTVFFSSCLLLSIFLNFSSFPPLPYPLPPSLPPLSSLCLLLSPEPQVVSQHSITRGREEE